MSPVSPAASPPEVQESRQRMLEIMAGAAGRVGHDLLGLAVPLRAVLEAAAADGVEVATAPEACRIIERLGAAMQMLAATERMSATAEPAAVYHTIEPLLKATLPRGLEVVAEFEDGGSVVAAGREAVAQALFRCCHAAAASAGAGGRLAVHCRRQEPEDALEIRFELGKPGPGAATAAGPGQGLLPRHDDPLIVALGATVEIGGGEAGPVVVLTIPLA